MSIRDEERLFRRVHIKQLVRDDDTGLARVSSGVFKDKELSVHIESVLREIGRSAESCLQNRNFLKLVAITAGNARHFNQAVCRNPIPNDPSHGLVCGSKNRKCIDGLKTSVAWVIPASSPRYEDIEAEKRSLGM